ncbi:MAG TPA: hypothetical protein VLR92_06220 [Blastocatellia bacterium]|nr:hypothetical protein [Blastocatellia bacterium]
MRVVPREEELREKVAIRVVGCNAMDEAEASECHEDKDAAC